MNLQLKRQIYHDHFTLSLFPYILSFIFFFLSLGNMEAQIKYPIISQTIITPPYPMSLEDFYADGGTKIKVQLLVKDVTLSNYPVKFRLVLTGRGVTIATSPSFVPEPFVLNGGETYSLSGADLAAYFNPNNLDFSGYSKAQYQRTGRLPDGVYQLSFEVIYYNRNINVASTTPALIWLSQNEPPLLNFPSKNQEISALTPQNIMFNWTLMHSPFSTPTLSPEYRFDLWEVWPDDKDPNDIVRSTQPIYTTTVKNTSLMYTVNEPFLLIGRRYVWRVRVVDPEGSARFTNDGYSETRWFRFGKVCPVPVISIDKVGASSFTVKWEGDYRQSRYEVRYREKKRKDAQWYTKNTTQLSATIDNLKSVTDYEVQVCGFCEEQPSDYSDMLTASTKAETKFECGVAPVRPDSVNGKPLDKLNPRDFIKAGDFDVLVTEASGSHGSFSGKGQVLVPYLKFLRVEVTFKNIKVNEDYKLTDGVIYTVYNLNRSMVLRTGNPSFLIPNPKKPVEDNGFASITTAKTTTDTTVTHIVFNNGGATITYANGKTETVRAAEGQVIAITDEKNKDQEQYVADTKTKTLYSGKPETLGSNANTPNATPQPKSGGTLYNVTFVRHNQESYGFDAPVENAPAGSYESVPIDGKPTLVPWKSIEAGNVDRVKAKVTGGPADSIHYRRESEQLVMTAKGNADTTQILLNGLGDMEEDYLYAWYPEYSQGKDSVKTQNRVLAGQLNMVSYQKQKLTVYLVPVNGCVYPQNIKDVQDYLNRIYGPALVEWIVKVDSGFNVTINGSKSKKIDNTVSDDNMDYSADMKVVNEAFATNALYNRDAYYLFFFDDATNQNIAGYMPFNQQFGYIFKYNQQLDVYLRTIAHELGHGPFRLYHTFSSKNKYVQTEGSTSNLMDYVDKSKAQTAIKLQKYQWDEIHSWHLGANWLESGDEAELDSKIKMKCLSASDAKKISSKVFYDLKGEQIYIKANGAPIGFSGTDESKENFPGSLARFKTDEYYYMPWKKGSTFSHYAPVGSQNIQYAYPTNYEGTPVKVFIIDNSNTCDVYIDKLPGVNIQPDFKTTYACNCSSTDEITQALLSQKLTWHNGAFPTDAISKVKYLSPSGLPIEIFGNWEVMVLKASSVSPYLPLTTPIFGFKRKSDGKVFVADISEKQFNGYKSSDGEIFKCTLTEQKHYDTDFEKDIKELHYHFYYYNFGNDGIVDQYYCKTLAIDPGYTAKGPLLESMDYCYDGCGTKECELDKLQISFTLLFKNNVSIKYNWDQKGGTLSQYQVGDRTFYVYGRVDNNVWTYFKLDVKKIGCCERWEKFNFPYPSINEQFKLLIDEVGHGTLDVIGIIPVVGEVADFVNGTWYILQGEKGEAFLCYASMLPLVGDGLVKGGKYTIKGIVALKTLKKFEFTEEATSLFSKISKRLTDIKASNIDKCLTEIGTLVNSNNKSLKEIEKLFNSLGETSKIESVFAKLNKLDAEKQAAFLADLVKDADKTGTLASNLSKIDESIVDAWVELSKVGVSQIKRTSLDILETASKHLSDNNFMTKLGKGSAESGKGRYAEIIEAYAGKCANCGNLGYKGLPDNPAEYLNSIESYSKKYGSVEGFDVPSFKGQPYSQEGFNHAMKQMNSSEISVDKVSKIDMKFEVEGLPCESCRFDVLMKDGNPIKYYEYKSYSDASKIPLEQFKNYLSSITESNQFRYIFDKTKLSVAQAQTGIITFMKKNRNDIFKSMKAELKESLELESVSDLSDKKIEEIVKIFVDAK